MKNKRKTCNALDVAWPKVFFLQRFIRPGQPGSQHHAMQFISIDVMRDVTVQFVQHGPQGLTPFAGAARRALGLFGMGPKKPGKLNPHRLGNGCSVLSSSAVFFHIGIPCGISNGWFHGFGDRHEHFAVFLARRRDGNLNIVAEYGQKVHEALDGKCSGLAAHQA